MCTQPRRISAITIAERVAAERGEALGDNVGYTIRLESRCLTRPVLPKGFGAQFCLPFWQRASMPGLNQFVLIPLAC